MGLTRTYKHKGGVVIELFVDICQVALWQFLY